MIFVVMYFCILLFTTSKLIFALHQTPWIRLQNLRFFATVHVTSLHKYLTMPKHKFPVAWWWANCKFTLVTSSNDIWVISFLVSVNVVQIIMQKLLVYRRKSSYEKHSAVILHTIKKLVPETCTCVGQSGTSFLHTTEHSSIPAQKLSSTWHEPCWRVAFGTRNWWTCVKFFVQVSGTSFWYKFPGRVPRYKY